MQRESRAHQFRLAAHGLKNKIKHWHASDLYRHLVAEGTFHCMECHQKTSWELAGLGLRHYLKINFTDDIKQLIARGEIFETQLFDKRSELTGEVEEPLVADNSSKSLTEPSMQETHKVQEGSPEINNVEVDVMPSDLVQRFEQVQKDIKTLSKMPSRPTLAQLYGYYKQAKSGDVQGDRPGMTNWLARAKYDSWATHRGMSEENAMQAYIDLVTELLAESSSL